MRNYGSTMKNYARALRRNLTPEEAHLWYDFLASFHPRFRRQQIVGQYILDFYCSECKLAIELDGSQHYEELGLKDDWQRTNWLEKHGIYVLRFINTDVKKNFAGVCQAIEREVLRRGGPPSTGCAGPPSPQAGQAFWGTDDDIDLYKKEGISK